MSFSNTKLSKTAAYTVTNSDKGVTFSLDGSSSFYLTFGAVGSYDNDFTCMIFIDGSAAKDVTINSVNFRMYPGDTAFIFNNQTVWGVHRNARHKLPSGVTNLYVNPGAAQTGWAAGNDNNDGLSQMSPKEHYQEALQTASGDFDFNGHQQTQIVINGASNTTDTVGIHYATHAVVGAQGGAAIKISGGTNSAIIPTSGTAIDVYNGAILQVENLKLASNNGACCGASYGGQLYLLNNVDLGSAAAYQIGANGMGHVICQGLITVSGSAPCFLENTYGYYECSGSTVRFMSNITYNWFVLMNFGVSTFGGQTIDLNGFTVTGARFLVANNGWCISNTGAPQTYFPGSTAGTTPNNGICI